MAAASSLDSEARASTSAELEPIEDAPRVGGDAVADGTGDVLQGVERPLQAARTGAVVGDRQQFFLRVGQPRLGARTYKTGVGHPLVRKGAEQGGQFRHVSHPRFFREAYQNAAEEADAAFRPFDVPAEPVEVVGRPAGQVAAAAATVRWGRLETAKG